MQTVVPVVKKPPKATVLRPDEEEELLTFILDKAKKGDVVLRKDVTDQVIKQYLQSDKRKNPFRVGIPGDKWFSLFRRRHNKRFKELDPEMLKNVENAVSFV